MLARYGGEEFALLVVDVNAERAVRRVDALRTALSALRVPLPVPLPVPLSASVASAAAGALLRDSATRHKIGQAIPTRVLE